MRRLHPRFSLLTVLLVMALVACGITIWQLWRELSPLRDEVRALRAESGLLTIYDTSKIHAIALTTLEDNTWRWRLYLPAGRQYSLYVQSGKAADALELDISNLTARLGLASAETPREALLTAGILVHERGGRSFSVRCEGGGFSVAMPEGSETWTVTTQSEVGKQTTIATVDQPFELFRLCGAAGSVRTGWANSECIALWLVAQ